MKILKRYQHLKILEKITYKKKINIVPTVDKNKMVIIFFNIKKFKLDGLHTSKENISRFDKL